MNLKKNDFIEIEYTGKIKEGEVFDTNIKEEAKKLNLNIAPKPLTICIGQGMILPAIDEFLEGKSMGEYTLNLTPEKAFGNRDKNLIKTFPIGVFKKQKLSPSPGMVFYFDNLVGRITAVSGGRVIVDFNNPLAGKNIEYKIIVKREITTIDEKVKGLFTFFLRKEPEFKVEDKKVIVESTKEQQRFIEALKHKFKEILGLDLVVKEKSK